MTPVAGVVFAGAFDDPARSHRHKWSFGNGGRFEALEGAERVEDLVDGEDFSTPKIAAEIDMFFCFGERRKDLPKNDILYFWEGGWEEFSPNDIFWKGFLTLGSSQFILWAVLLWLSLLSSWMLCVMILPGVNLNSVMHIIWCNFIVTPHDG